MPHITDLYNRTVKRPAVSRSEVSKAKVRSTERSVALNLKPRPPSASLGGARVLDD